MNPYPIFRMPLGYACHLFLLASLLSACEDPAEVAGETCTESQAFFLPAQEADAGLETGMAPDIRLSIYTLDETTGCLEPVLDANCVEGNCDQALSAAVDRQVLFLRVVAMDEGGMRSLDLDLQGGYFSQTGKWSESPWLAFDYSLNGSRAAMLSEVPMEALFFQDRFELNAANPSMSITLRAQDHGLPGSDPALSELAVSVSLLENLSTSRP